MAEPELRPARAWPTQRPAKLEAVLRMMHATIKIAELIMDTVERPHRSTNVDVNMCAHSEVAVPIDAETRVGSKKNDN